MRQPLRCGDEDAACGGNAIVVVEPGRGWTGENRQRLEPPGPLLSNGRVALALVALVALAAWMLRMPPVVAAAAITVLYSGWGTGRPKR